MKHSGQTLRQRVQHLMLDYRYIIVGERLKTINQQLKTSAGDMEKLRELMKAYMDTSKIYQELGRQLGRN